VRRRSAVLLLALGVLAACGLPEDDSPRAISADDAPLTIGSEAPTTAAPGGATDAELWFVSGDRLVAVDREVSARTPDVVLPALLDGVTAEDPPGLSTAIPDDTVLNRAVVDGVTLTVDIGPAGGGILGISGPVQLRAFGQIVLTALELPGVEGVRFLVDGTAVDAPTEQGSQPGPLTADHYASLLPP
jgi:spore germination protein GerM